MRAAAGGVDGDALGFLLAHLPRLGGTPEGRDVVFESLDLPVRWALGAHGVATGGLRLPDARIAPRRARPARRVSARRHAARPLPQPIPVRRPTARTLIEVARLALASRGRETDATTYANPDEVYRTELEAGLEVVVLGMAPDRRLPIESFFGYLAARNGVPIAYGGAWVFFDRGEIGINVFDAFRRGDSTRLFAEIMRVYHHHFGVTHLEVDPFQFGADNPEAIRSGAFWFYYKLGFRPVDPEIRDLATREARAVRRDRRHRSSRATLRRLASSRLRLQLVPGTAATTPPTLSTLGARVTEEIAARFAGNRNRAERWAWRRVRELAPEVDVDAWSSSERRSASRLAVLHALLPGVEAWSRRDRRALLEVLRSKGGPRERDYVLRARAHPRLVDALRAFSGDGTTEGVDGRA
jgi:hypothetical protein